VAARGDILALKRAVGFLPGAELDRFVVVQVDRMTQTLDTVIVCPLDEAVEAYSAMPGAVPVSPSEAGTKKKQVAIATQIVTLPLSRFEASIAGRLTRTTRSRLDDVLKLVLELR